MSIDKRLISTGAGLCTADTLDVFGDSSCVALYGLNYDASDAGGNYNGTSTDVTFNEPGYIDYAASFNGTSSYVQVGTSDMITGTAFSVSIWVIDEATSGNRELFTQQADNNKGLYIGRGSSANTLRFNDLLITCSLGSSWNHLTFTVNGSTAKTYQNGSLIDTKTNWSFFASEAVRNGSGVRIGRQHGTYDEYWLGKIDQLRVFNKELSASEVTTLYGEVACEYTCTTDTNGFPSTASSDLAAYWKFDGDATDETGSYNGTRNGSYSWVGGRYGSAFQSNGSTGYISTSLTLPSTNYAFSYWAYNNGGAHQFIIDTAGSGVGITMKCRFSENKIEWTNWNVEAFNIDVTFKEGWNHVVQQISSVNGKQIYLNGSYAGGNSTTSITNNSNIGVRIGGYPPFNYFSSCPIDQIRYYTKALSSTEVTALYEEEQQCYITAGSTDPFGDGNNIALYKLENNADDANGSYNGTASNMTYGTDSIIGTYAAGFNGSSSSITTSMSSSNLGTNGAASFSWWWKPNTSGTTIHFLFEGNLEYAYGIHTGGGAGTLGLRFMLGNTIGTNINLDVSNAYTTGVWQHHAITVGGGDIKLYRNGSQIGSQTYPGTPKSFSSFIFGRRSTSYYYSGLMDQVRIFDRALNGDEVWKLYAEVAKG